MTGRATPDVVAESIVDPNGQFMLAWACPTGKHVGAVHAHFGGGRMVLDHPPIYVCGCIDPRKATR